MVDEFAPVPGVRQKKEKIKSTLPHPPRPPRAPRRTLFILGGGRWTGEEGRGAGLPNTCHWEACGTVSEWAWICGRETGLALCCERGTYTRALSLSLLLKCDWRECRWHLICIKGSGGAAFGILWFLIFHAGLHLWGTFLSLMALAFGLEAENNNSSAAVQTTFQSIVLFADY